MNTCGARVVELIDGDAVVELEPRRHACAQCPKPGGCHSALDGLAANARLLRLPNRIDARIGDAVSVTVAEGMVWRASLFSYLIPIALAIAGAAIGQGCGGDLAAIVGMLLGLAGGLTVLRYVGRAGRDDNVALRLSAGAPASMCEEDS